MVPSDSYFMPASLIKILKVLQVVCYGVRRVPVHCLRPCRDRSENIVGKYYFFSSLYGDSFPFLVQVQFSSSIHRPEGATEQVDEHVAVCPFSRSACCGTCVWDSVVKWFKMLWLAKKRKERDVQINDCILSYGPIQVRQGVIWM